MAVRPVHLFEEERAVKLNMTAVYSAPGYSRRELVLCCDDMRRELRASETKDPTVGHAAVRPDLVSGGIEVAVQAEGDTYDAAATRATRRLDHAVTAVTTGSRAGLEELHSELWCRKTPDICRARATQEAHRTGPEDARATTGGRPYALRILSLRLAGMCGFAATVVLAVAATHHGGLDLPLVIGASLCALLGIAAWTYMAVVDVKACRGDPRRPEDVER
jgi:hypothetical protein